MEEASPAVSIDALPDDVLVSIFSRLSFSERLHLGTVCRRWHAASLSPRLLENVSIYVGVRNSSRWLDALRGASSWLVRRAAGSVSALTLDVYQAPDATPAETAEAEALLVGTIAAVGASGSLAELTIVAPGLSLHIGGWASALRSLFQLTIKGPPEVTALSGDLRGMTQLLRLHLDGNCCGIAADAQLPASLEHLYLGCNVHPDTEQTINQTLPVQVAGLTRLHTLHLESCFYQSHQYSPLAALGGTLQFLCLANFYCLPDCLPQMRALRTLTIIDDSGMLGGSQPEGPHNIQLLEAALRQLPRLTSLAVDLKCASQVVLVPGPWQHTVKHLAANADLLVSSWAAVSDVPRLEWLGIGAAGRQHQQPAALRILSWVAQQQAPALQRLGLELHPNESPSVALFDACLAAKGANPALAIRVVPSKQYHSMMTFWLAPPSHSLPSSD